MENRIPLPKKIGMTISEVSQLCPTLCDPMDYSPPSMEGRVLEWVTYYPSNPLLDIYPKETKTLIQKDICIPMLPYVRCSTIYSI